MAKRRKRRIRWEPEQAKAFTLEDEDYGLPRHRRAVRRLAESATPPAEPGTMGAAAWSAPGRTAAPPSPQLARTRLPSTIPLGRRIGPYAKAFMARTRAAQAIPLKRVAAAKASPEVKAIDTAWEEHKDNPEMRRRIADYAEKQGLTDSRAYLEGRMYRDIGQWPKPKAEREAARKADLAREYGELVPATALEWVGKFNLRTWGVDGLDEDGNRDRGELDAIHYTDKIKQAALRHEISPMEAAKLMYERGRAVISGKVTEREKVKAAERKAELGEVEARRKEAARGEIEALKVEQGALKRKYGRLVKLRDAALAKQLATPAGSAGRAAADAELTEAQGKLDEIETKTTALESRLQAQHRGDLEPTGAVEPEPEPLPETQIEAAGMEGVGPESQIEAAGMPEEEAPPAIPPGPDFEMARGQIEAGEALEVLKGMKLTKDDIAALVALYKARQLR